MSHHCPHTHTTQPPSNDMTHNIRFATGTCDNKQSERVLLGAMHFRLDRVLKLLVDLIQSFSFSSSGAVAAVLCVPGGELTQTDSSLNALGASFHGDRA